MARLYMQGLHKFPNMFEYGFIRLNNPWISLNMPEHGWMLLNVSEYAEKCLNKLFWLYQGSQYAPI